MWLHFVFGRYGSAYRYEGYLIALGVIGLGLAIAQKRLGVPIGTMTVLATFCLVFHAVRATYTFPGRSLAIYSQQYQTARFAQMLNTTIAVNDLGCPTYFTELPVIDLVGLGTQEVMAWRTNHVYTTDDLSRLFRKRGVRVAAVYDSWFTTGPRTFVGGPPIPKDMIRAATFHIADPYEYVGAEDVTYYAAPGEQQHLRRAVERLRATLPTNVSVRLESD